MGAAAASGTLAGCAGARASPFGAVVLVGLLLVAVTPVPIVVAITVTTTTASSTTTSSTSSSVVATWIITTTPATVVIEGSSVATETPIVPTVALEISGWVVSFTTRGAGARPGAREQRKRRETFLWARNFCNVNKQVKLAIRQVSK